MAHVQCTLPTFHTGIQESNASPAPVLQQIIPSQVVKTSMQSIAEGAARKLLCFTQKFPCDFQKKCPSLSPLTKKSHFDILCQRKPLVCNW